MTKTPTSAPQTTKALRSDGVEARNRLLYAALDLFADKGFSKTSTREIALAAQVNIASISYYFGDKAGLYKAVFTDPRVNPTVPPEHIDNPSQPLQVSITTLMRSFVDPLKQGHLAQQCMKLHFREMLEPTGISQAEVERNIKPTHDALATALCRHLGVAQPDDEIHRLSLAISGMGVMLQISTDVTNGVRPGLIASHAALDVYCDRLVDYAMALTAAEAQRRARPDTPPTAKTKTKVRPAEKNSVHSPSLSRRSKHPTAPT
ncbi:TetR/AcrR family transcriptional regulator [Rhodoferax sp.]|uniref:TetR/AcrR family transcriptional regulator n=1 Tax=Rhodoferax sp. TaxID=50421 RepID=UPI0025EF57B4|nr:TetR/AcrR family transcriptional regulator [Rhodoferax sp.]MCM2342474.1 CerR family C-terminal domain-containing protein [Rhodoferax sp.]